MVECFFRGNGSSQNALHEFFGGMLRREFGRISDAESLTTWLQNTIKELDDQEAGSRMRRMRKVWLKQNLLDVLADVQSLPKTEG